MDIRVPATERHLVFYFFTFLHFFFFHLFSSLEESHERFFSSCILSSPERSLSANVFIGRDMKPKIG